MNDYTPILKQQPFFADMEAADLENIAACAQEVYFEEDEVIFHAHDFANMFYVLVSGSAALKVHVPHLGPIPVQTLKAGDSLGWSWLVPPYHWHFDARAIEPIRALVFDARQLRHQMDDHPEFGYRLMKQVVAMMAHRLQSTRLQLLDMYEART